MNRCLWSEVSHDVLHSGGAEKAVPGRVFAEALSDAGVAVSAVTKTVTLAFRTKKGFQWRSWKPLLLSNLNGCGGQI